MYRIGIIPAAGKGLRLKELGKQYPKALLPYKEKPLIIHNINWLLKHNCQEIRIVINHHADKVKEMVNFYYPNSDNIKYYHQKNQNGLSGAILTAMDTDQSFNSSALIVLGDIISDFDFVESTFKNNFISVTEVPGYSRWCMVECNSDGSVKQFFDKPTEKPPTTTGVSGLYHIKNLSKFKNLLQQQIDNDDKIAGEFQLSSVFEKFEDPIYCYYGEIIDFGTLEEYLKNRGIRESRSFNELIVSNNTIIKSSDNTDKLLAEYNWFRSLPIDLLIHTPRILNSDFFSDSKPFYSMEKILSPSLREYYLFLDSDIENWEIIFNELFRIIDIMKNFRIDSSDFLTSMFEKTQRRIEDISPHIIDKKYTNNFIQNIFKPAIKNNTKKDCLIHGDLVLSNILYNPTLNQIKLIDPRGNMFGSEYYEVAKILQSIKYDYDFIDMELYALNSDDYKIYNDGKELIKKLFLTKLRERYNPEEIKIIHIICASLLLSLIPLHSHNENNQKIYYSLFVKSVNDALIE